MPRNAVSNRAAFLDVGLAAAIPVGFLTGTQLSRKNEARVQNLGER
jgi:hypothetical protein